MTKCALCSDNKYALYSTGDCQLGVPYCEKIDISKLTLNEWCQCQNSQYLLNLENNLIKGTCKDSCLSN